MADTRAAGYPILISGEKSFQLDRLQNESRDEEWLQRLIHRHPRCLPMEQIEPGFERLIPICIELPVLGGWVDNLLMTPDGNVVMVEVKLWRNPEARRKVVAQALEYATGLFRMDYEALENAVLNAKFVDAEKPNRLYDMFSHDPEALPEDKFIDRVNHNLINGRIVVLIVGDGIRTQLEDLYDGLQAHANFQFTFALIEMPVFRRAIDDTSEELIVTPRTLLKTAIVERFTIRVKNDEVVKVEDAHVSTSDKKTSPRRRNITANQFYEAIEENYSIEVRKKLEDFVASLEYSGVFPDFLSSLNLKWSSPVGKSINLGYIDKEGYIATDSSYWFAPEHLAEQYNQRLANVMGGKVRGQTGRRWIVRGDDSLFRVDEIIEKSDGWREAIEIFLNDLNEHLAIDNS